VWTTEKDPKISNTQDAHSPEESCTKDLPKIEIQKRSPSPPLRIIKSSQRDEKAWSILCLQDSGNL
jgi:hypothetical protein